jgi:hypothetical protein
MFVSMILYKARQTNSSNILKIIFNFAQIVRYGSDFGLYMTPKIATYTQCDALLKTIMIGNILTIIIRPFQFNTMFNVILEINF